MTLEQIYKNTIKELENLDITMEKVGNQNIWIPEYNFDGKTINIDFDGELLKISLLNDFQKGYYCKSHLIIFTGKNPYTNQLALTDILNYYYCDITP